LIHQPPRLAVDRFADVAVIHTPLDATIPDLRSIESACTTGYVKVHARNAREYIARTEPAWGPPRDEVVVTECGVRYLVRPSVGLAVGLFIDMREVRRWLRSVTEGQRVLNLFAYTCAFGVCAALGGAGRVVNLDLSRTYLEWGKANYALNGVAADPHDFIYGDALDWLGRFARRSQEFDTVIVDPPSFSTTPFSVTRDYPRLVALAARVVVRDGLLLAATNHAQTSDARFDRWIHAGLAAAGRRGALTRWWHEPADDFPVPKGQRPYLKVRALQLD
jgi:23S rRNA (cytosine1962-C5)-methyltransferase